MRGKVSIIQLPFRLCGITPAYAGKRQIWTWESWGSGDHPRLCGEKFIDKLFNTFITGSPPPMRGKVISSI